MLMDFIPYFFLSLFRIIWLSFLERKEQSNMYVYIIFQFALFAYLYISAYLVQCIFSIFLMLHTTKFESIDIHFAFEHLQVIVKSFLPYKGLVTEHLFQRTKWQLLRRNFVHINCFIKSAELEKNIEIISLQRNSNLNEF